jgi:putative phage-type endonuclease
MSVDIQQEAPQKPDYRTPGSRLILKASAPRREWLRARMQGLGGSDISAILGFSKYSDAYRVYLDKIADPDYVGDDDWAANNRFIRAGKKLEPVFREMFTEDTGINIRMTGLHRSRDYPFMQVTVDGLTSDGGIFESKNTGYFMGEEWEDGQVPDHAELQVQHGMAVTGRSHAWVTGFIGGNDFRVVRVERDDTLIENLIELERKFWTENVLARREPALSHVSLGYMKDRFGLADADSKIEQPKDVVESLKSKIESAKERIAEAAKEKDTAEAELRLLAQHHDIITCDGKPYVTLKQNSTFSSSRFTQDHPDLAKELTVLKPVLDMDALKSEHPEIYTRYRARVLRFPKVK